MNSSYDNEPRIRERTDPATITLHPDDAAARGLKAGDMARLSNETAALTMRVAVDDLTPRGVGWAPKGRWPGAAPEGLNVNALNPGLRSDMGDSTALHGVEVSVTAA
jgi:anaerobic selenocysteine-containing dehydrogenase